MKQVKNVIAVFALAILVLGLNACAKKADENKSIDQIKTEVQAMSINDLQANAEAYAKAIAAQKGEVEKITAKLKDLSPAEIFSEKAKSIKSELSALQGKFDALSDRYSIYAEKYKEMGGDIAKISVS